MINNNKWQCWMWIAEAYCHNHSPSQRAWCSVCIHQMNRVKFYNGFATMTPA